MQLCRDDLYLHCFISWSSSFKLVFLSHIIHVLPHSSDLTLRLKEEDDESVSLKALPMNQQKEKRRYSGVKIKGFQPISSPEVAPIKTSKGEKASVFHVTSVPEEIQDHQSTKTTRKKQKVQMPKVK